MNFMIICPRCWCGDVMRNDECKKRVCNKFFLEQIRYNLGHVNIDGKASEVQHPCAQYIPPGFQISGGNNLKSGIL